MIFAPTAGAGHLAHLEIAAVIVWKRYGTLAFT